MSDLVQRAQIFSTKAHGEIGQVRKYTDEPYIVHPASVAARVMTVSNDEHLIAAAWLHDTVEDTKVTMKDIRAEFGETVAGLVESLTDVTTLQVGNRKIRKEIERQHTAQASLGAKTVKLADLIDNAHSILQYDKGFSHKFMWEMKLLLDVLVEGDPTLYDEARLIVNEFYRKTRGGYLK